MSLYTNYLDTFESVYKDMQMNWNLALNTFGPFTETDFEVMHFQTELLYFCRVMNRLLFYTTTLIEQIFLFNFIVNNFDHQKKGLMFVDLLDEDLDFYEEVKIKIFEYFMNSTYVPALERVLDCYSFNENQKELIASHIVAIKLCASVNKNN